MAVIQREIASDVLTYEDYLLEGEIDRRYDILDGVRLFMTNPTRKHQKILLKIARIFLAYQESTGMGEALVAPCDVLITCRPLRTRQPDVLLISKERLAMSGSDDDPAPLAAAPELVVEILSPSETRSAREEKIEEYRSVDVRECWVVSPADGTGELLRLSPGGIQSAAVYTVGQRVRSEVFSGLEASVAEILAV